jgi:hypothetical protein
MNGMEAVFWITSVCLGLRKSRTNTLARDCGTGIMAI